MTTDFVEEKLSTSQRTAKSTTAIARESNFISDIRVICGWGKKVSGTVFANSPALL